MQWNHLLTILIPTLVTRYFFKFNSKQIGKRNTKVTQCWTYQITPLLYYYILFQLTISEMEFWMVLYPKKIWRKQNFGLNFFYEAGRLDRKLLRNCMWGGPEVRCSQQQQHSTNSNNTALLAPHQLSFFLHRNMINSTRSQPLSSATACLLFT